MPKAVSQTAHAMPASARHRAWRQKRLPAYALAAPGFLLLAAITLYPVFDGLFVSFHQWNWSYGQAGSMRWIGLSNYQNLLSDSLFWSSLGHTLMFSGMAITLEFGLGLLCAILLNLDLPGITLFRSAIIFPLMIADIVAAVMWKMLLDPSQGFINYVLGTLNLPTPDWLGDPTAAMPALAVVDAWWQTGNIVLILLAGLQSLPRDLIEMSMIDGASALQTFRYIALPWLRPFILFALLFRAVDLLRVFALVWGTTAGGPANETIVSQLYIYTQGLGNYLNIGYASALAVVLALIMGILVVLYLRFTPEVAV